MFSYYVGDYNDYYPYAYDFAPKLQDFLDIVINQINPDRIADKRKPIIKFTNPPGHDERTWILNVSGSITHTTPFLGFMARK